MMQCVFNVDLVKEEAKCLTDIRRYRLIEKKIFCVYLANKKS